MSITELLNIVTVFSILLPAAAMVREKERGGRQLLVSPCRRSDCFPRSAGDDAGDCAGQRALALLPMLLLGFAVPVRGSAVLFLLLTALYVFTTAGLGLAAAAGAQSGAGGHHAVNFDSGADNRFCLWRWTPPEAMPAWLRALTYLSPMRYYIDAAFGVLLKGQGALELWRSLLGMTLIGVTVFVWGLRRVRMG
ncbi:MAG: ABC transporter permease [Rivihabitans pingtungensis]